MVLVLLCLAQFMLIIDITVVQVALPSIGTGLGLDREALTWVVTAYTLCFGGLMVLGGRLTDAFGARRVLLGGLALFTLASLLCGLAPDGATLIAGRALQGVGAALLSPAALATITTAFHGERRTRALAVWAAIGGTGAAVGVLVGGLLTAGPGWEWAFFVNVPVGLVVMVALPSLVPASMATERRPLDVPGARCWSRRRPGCSSTAWSRRARRAGAPRAPGWPAPRRCTRPSCGPSGWRRRRSCAPRRWPGGPCCPACSSCSWRRGSCSGCSSSARSTCSRCCASAPWRRGCCSCPSRSPSRSARTSADA
ncbi:MFS transporter [Nonomuraea dietziae]|uniref:MFS transporter n=1 Tax=Nonomuraea dietziae TaxID=65515 RepID=UPI0031D1FB63